MLDLQFDEPSVNHPVDVPAASPHTLPFSTAGDLAQSVTLLKVLYEISANKVSPEMHCD